MLRASEKRPSISTLALGVPREDSDPLPTACRDLEFEPPNTLGRMAVWIVISFLAIGTAFFSTAEGWSAADALYFCVVTVTTTGFGDFVPTSDGSKLFCVCYILVGLSIFSTCLGIVVGKVNNFFDERLRSLPRKRRFQLRAFHCVVVPTCWLSIGACIVAFSEGWGLVDSVYWSVVGTSTVGFGELTIQQPLTRRLVTFYLLLAVGGCAVSLSRLGSMFMELEMERAVDAFVARGVSQAMLYEMDENHTGTIDRGEFLKYILLAMGKVEPEDVEKALRMFDQLDPQAQLEGVIDVARVSKSMQLTKSFSGKASREEAIREKMSGGGGGGGIAPLSQPLLDKNEIRQVSRRGEEA